jgi:hypothetical protein
MSKSKEKYYEYLKKEAQKQANQASVTGATQPQQPDAVRAQTIAQRQQRENEAGAKGYQEMMSRMQNAQGFSPEQARAMQYEAHKGIQRREQSAQRNLVGAQGSQGIGGRSGIGYAQRRDLNRGFGEQHGQAQRDYERLNAEQRLANVGAGTAYEMGEKARMSTDWEAELAREEREKQRKANPYGVTQAYQQFSRM